MNFDNPKVYGDTFISDGLVYKVKRQRPQRDCFWREASQLTSLMLHREGVGNVLNTSRILFVVLILKGCQFILSGGFSNSEFVV